MRTLKDEIEIIEACTPLAERNGGIWFRNNNNMPDARFEDWGASRAFARAATELPDLVKALESAMGYLLNAEIDLATGAPKKTAVATIQGGLRMIRAALEKAGA
jgi:hypothetical protein